jgi:uncharacterized protein YndB with AHSA1/START domain
MTTGQRQVPSLTVTAPGEHEIHFERTFEAPRDVVWRAFTDPTLISEWWGGGATVEEMDVRVGGSWKFLGGHGPGGQYVFQGEYLEVDPPHRLVQTHQNAWFSGLVYTESLEFEDLGDNRTRFTQTTRFDTTEQRDMVFQTAEQGAHFTYSRLDQLLARLSNSNG